VGREKWLLKSAISYLTSNNCFYLEAGCGFLESLYVLINVLSVVGWFTRGKKPSEEGFGEIHMTFVRILRL
jgi:hypothetical protein